MSSKGMLTPAVPESLLASAAAPQTPEKSSGFASTDRMLKSVSSPDLAQHKLSRISELAERVRGAQRHDSEWARRIQEWDAHKRQLDEDRRRLVSSLQRESARRARKNEERDAAAATCERRVMLRAVNAQNAERAELSRQADEDASAKRHGRDLEHQDYLARMRREAEARAKEVQRANASKEEEQRLVSARCEQRLRDRADHSAAERRAYEERRLLVDERGRQTRLRRNAEEGAQFSERQRQTSERLTQLSSRKEADTQGKARRLDGYMASAAQTLGEALRTRQELQEAQYTLSSSKSVSQMSSYRAAQDDWVRGYRARYDANREGGARRVAAMCAERERDIRISLSTKQARLDDLFHRRAVRDSEVAQHTASQLLMSHALSDAEWRLLVKSDFSAGEVGRQLGSAQSVCASSFGSRGGLSSCGSMGSLRPPPSRHIELDRRAELLRAAVVQARRAEEPR